MPRQDDQNPLDRLHPGEPWFLIRGQDRFAVGAVAGYAEGLALAAYELEERGDPEAAAHLHDMEGQVRQVVEGIRSWQDDNPDVVKTPD